MNYRTLIIEDEYLAAEELRKMLEQHPEITVLGVADSIPLALTLIQTLQPQLLLLDINLRGASGFDLLAQLDEVPLVVFITAYDQYAIQAFEVNALDYLLKPVNPQRLAEAIAKIKKQLQPQVNDAPPLRIDQRIFIKDGNQCFFVPLAEIFLIESVGNYARVYFGKHKTLLHKSLNYLEKKLPISHFFRANRQYILNVEHIQHIQPYFSHTLLVDLPGGHQVEISQRQSVKFKDRMGI